MVADDAGGASLLLVLFLLSAGSGVATFHVVFAAGARSAARGLAVAGGWQGPYCGAVGGEWMVGSRADMLSPSLRPQLGAGQGEALQKPTL
jgi:hypothetical protein